MPSTLLFARCKPKDLIPGSLPNHIELGQGQHLFEQIHGKDPCVAVEALHALGLGGKDYHLEEVE